MEIATQDRNTQKNSHSHTKRERIKRQTKKEGSNQTSKQTHK